MIDGCIKFKREACLLFYLCYISREQSVTSSWTHRFCQHYIISDAYLLHLIYSLWFSFFLCFLFFSFSFSFSPSASLPPFLLLSFSNNWYSLSLLTKLVGYDPWCDLVIDDGLWLSDLAFCSQVLHTVLNHFPFCYQLLHHGAEYYLHSWIHDALGSSILPPSIALHRAWITFRFFIDSKHVIQEYEGIVV